MIRLGVCFGLAGICATGALFSLVEQAKAQGTFPQHEITVVVPWSVGGRTDVASRIWAPPLSEVFGVPIVIENRPGGGGVVGAHHVARSTADGHTIGIFSISHIVAQWTKAPPFDLEAYTPVGLPFDTPFVLLVRSDAPWQDLQAFVDHAKENRVSFATSGAGASIHIAAAAFADAAGIQARYIPYDGDAGAIAAMISEEADVTLMPMAAAAGQVGAGELVPLAVSSARTDDIHAGIPTFLEAADVEFVMGDLGSGVFVPRGTPDSVVEQWEEALADVLTRPEVRDGLERLYIEPDFANQEEFRRRLDEWVPRLEGLVHELGLAIQ